MQEQDEPDHSAAALPEYLTTEDVAKRYRRSPATVRYWRSTGFGPRGTKVGRRVLYPRAAIEQFDAEVATAAGMAAAS